MHKVKKSDQRLCAKMQEGLLQTVLTWGHQTPRITSEAAAALVSSQRLWLPTPDPHKTKPGKHSSMDPEGATEVSAQAEELLMAWVGGWRENYSSLAGTHVSRR